MSSDRRAAPPGAGRARTGTLSSLLRAFASDAALLVRQEIALARAEVRQAVRGFAGGAGRVAMGGGVAGVGALTVVAGLVVLLGELIGSYWASALIVGGVLLAIGGTMALLGVRRLRGVDPAPRATIETLGATVAWARAEAADLKASLLGKGRRRPRPDGRVRAGDGAPPRALLPERASAPPPASPTLTGAAALPKAATAAVAQLRAAPVAAPFTSPENLPPPSSTGLLPFLKHVGKEIQDDEITGHAAKLAYYGFLAMPPALMALFGLAGLIGSEWLAAWLQEQASLALPPAVSESIVTPFIEQVVLEEAPGPFSIGLLLALWGGSSLFVGLIDTLNHAYDLEESRSFFRKRALALATMLGSAGLVGVAAGTLLVGPVVIDALGLREFGTIFWNLAQWPVAFLFVVAAFWSAYYFLPNRDQRGCRKLLLKAAAVAAAVWVLATAGFRFYIANFSSYSETYGFLGAFIILLLWLYVTGLVVLAGGELASEMERRPA